MAIAILSPRATWKLRGNAPMNPHCKWYSWGDCNVFVGQEPVVGDPWPKSWHMSISTPHRNPTWEEIKQARYYLIPHDVTMAMILPPTDQYVNIHNFCFHLHQIPNEA
jgi:hypothetical protein